jgi:hypothetical protein
LQCVWKWVQWFNPERVLYFILSNTKNKID